MEPEDNALDSYLVARTNLREVLGIEETEVLHDLRGRAWVIATRPDDPRSHRPDLHFAGADGMSECAFAPHVSSREVGLLVVVRNGHPDEPHVYVFDAADEATAALATPAWNKWKAAERDADRNLARQSRLSMVPTER